MQQLRTVHRLNVIIKAPGRKLGLCLGISKGRDNKDVSDYTIHADTADNSTEALKENL